MKKLFFILLWVGGIASGLTSCIESNRGGNYQTFPIAPVVVNYNPEKGGTTMLTVWGEIGAPELSQFDQGDCLFSQFSIDYDYQPSSSYFTATEISYTDRIEVANASIEEDSVSVGDYTIPITELYISPYNNPLFLKGRFFFQMKHKTIENPKIEYKLLTSRKEVDDKGVYNMYLIANQEKGEGKEVEVTRSQVFVINNLLMTLGKDTTINNSVKVKYLKVNLKYYNKEKEDAPFKNYDSIELVIYN
jgi:hypothetical protein